MIPANWLAQAGTIWVHLMGSGHVMGRWACEHLRLYYDSHNGIVAAPPHICK